MKSSEAQNQLRDRLRAVGFDFENPSPLLAWSVFKEFVREPVEDIAKGDDMVLFECGVYNFTGEDLFSLGFVRQFSFNDEDGEYEHMEQLHCTFSCAPTDELRGLEKNAWAENFDTLDAYFAHVEALPGFQIPTQSPQNWTCEVEQHVV